MSNKPKQPKTKGLLKERSYVEIKRQDINVTKQIFKDWWLFVKPLKGMKWTYYATILPVGLKLIFNICASLFFLVCCTITIPTDIYYSTKKKRKAKIIKKYG